MPRSIQVAVIQMDGAPATTSERLQRAETLIQSAVDKGAELLVLPALFNTGKTFHESNYELTERLSDLTMQWMCNQAQSHQIHMAGSWMMVDKDDTYHSAFLIAPDGTTWRYDQQYPYLWERVFYRDGHGITVASTSLGKIGFMIAWDGAHPELWERYAAKVDLMIILNDSLDLENARLTYTDGTHLTVNRFGFFAKWLAQSTTNYFQADTQSQAKWMQVPVMVAGLSGEFTSILPAPFFSVQALLWGHPSLWVQANNQYAEMQLQAHFQNETSIIDRNGDILVEILEQGDTVLVGSIELADKTPLPLDEAQPDMHVPELAQTIIDLISSALLTLNYRRGVRRQWGARMAPMDAKTRIWLRILLVVVGLSIILSRLFFPKRR